MYYSFTKIINSIELELKVRYKNTTLKILELHEEIKNEISEEQEKYYTFAKVLIKELSEYEFPKVIIDLS